MQQGYLGFALNPISLLSLNFFHLGDLSISLLDNALIDINP
jgi:hypothetical protein